MPGDYGNCSNTSITGRIFYLFFHQTYLIQRLVPQTAIKDLQSNYLTYKHPGSVLRCDNPILLLEQAHGRPRYFPNQRGEMQESPSVWKTRRAKRDTNLCILSNLHRLIQTSKLVVRENSSDAIRHFKHIKTWQGQVEIKI